MITETSPVKNQLNYRKKNRNRSFIDLVFIGSSEGLELLSMRKTTVFRCLKSQRSD